MKEVENLRKYFKQERNLENFNKMMEDVVYILDNLDIFEVDEYIRSDKDKKIYRLVFRLGLFYTDIIDIYLNDFIEKIVKDNIDYLDISVLRETLRMNGLDEVLDKTGI